MEGQRWGGEERDMEGKGRRQRETYALGKCPWSSRGRRKEKGTMKEMGEAANWRREDN